MYSLLKSFILLFLSSACINNLPSPNLNSHSPSTPKELKGSWVYSLNIRSTEDNSIHESPFFIRIDDGVIYSEKNAIECNTCHKQFVTKGNKIIYPNSSSSPICTELECLISFRLNTEDNPETITYIFGEMTFEIIDEQLHLKNKNGETLILTRA